MTLEASGSPRVDERRASALRASARRHLWRQGPELRRRGLICRAADRGYPVIQLAPPLIAGPAELAEIGRILRAVLEEAARPVARG